MAIEMSRCRGRTVN